VTKELRDKLIFSASGLLVGILTSYLAMMRDVAVIKEAMSHLKQDISVIQMFIASDDPKAWLEAKNKIREEHSKDEKD